LPLQLIKSAKSFLSDYNPQSSYQFLSAILIGGIVEELYYVVVLPGVQRPMAVGFKTDDNSTNCNNWFGFVEVSLDPIKRKKLLA
jgi:hypothetical protein